jgi:adenylate cyclase
VVSERIERRLTAILAADVVGYSRLTGVDEEGTHVQLKEHVRVLIDPKITEHHGRVVKNTGDGLLAEFSSVVEAVRCAGGCSARHGGAQQRRAKGRSDRVSHRHQCR